MPSVRRCYGASTGRSRLPLGFLWDSAKSIPVALFLFFVVRAFLVEAFKIPSGSMEGTLLVGDFLLVNKLVYGAEVPFTDRQLPAIRAPQRGDVVVFQFPADPSKNFVKRLVGLPGDTLAMQDGVLYRNGLVQQERYVRHSEPGVDPVAEDFRWQRNYLVRTAEARGGFHPSRNNWGRSSSRSAASSCSATNRDNSLDSRVLGLRPRLAGPGAAPCSSITATRRIPPGISRG
jgi:signal peptidase I